jgi:YYY domain-containing protein
MAIVVFLLVVTVAGLGGYALLVRAGLDDLEAWAGGRLAGLVLAVLPAWWLGVVGVARWRVVGAVLLLIFAAVGARVVWRRRAWRQVAVGEAIFWIAAALVIFIRLDHPDIALTEKPMDLGILASLLRTEAFPPPDMWLAGETLPYYYWGALLWTVPLWMSSLPLEFGYNLIVGLVGGMVACTMWMLGRRLGGSHWSGLLAAFFGVFAGTPDGFRQLVAGARVIGLDYWHSSRQVADTITEFPLFTLWLGDLHPHLLSMPIICLALLVAARVGRSNDGFLEVAVLTVLFGVAWAANPWCMPPTLVGIALFLLAGSDRWYWPGGEGSRRWLTIVAVAAGGWIVTAPFHLGFQAPFEGVKRVFAWTEPTEILLYAGCLLIPAALAALALLRGALEGEPEVRRAVTLAFAAAVLVLAAAVGRPTLIFLLACLALLVAGVLGSWAGKDRPAIALASLGVFLFLVPEFVYVVDGYGSEMHRMNTVFKSYIQGWVFLAAALPVLVRVAARRRWARVALVSAAVVAAVPHPLGMVAKQITAAEWSLDGMRWMPAGDRAIVRYLREQPVGTVIAEAVAGPYSEYARLSSASGVPCVLGWTNHELVWRGNEILEETGRREELILQIYTSGDPETVRSLIEKEDVHLVAVGSLERRDYPAEGIAAVVEAGEVVVEEEGAVLVRFGYPGTVAASEEGQ